MGQLFVDSRAAVVATALLATQLGLMNPAVSQDTGAAIHDDKTVAGYTDTPQFGGSNSVGGQLRSDDEVKKSTFRFEGFTRSVQPYYDFKEKVKKEYGLAFGADYGITYQHASESLGEDDAAGGVIRLYGTWTLVGRDSGNTGSLTVKVENRHRIGTAIAPQGLASEVGYAGLTSITYSDAGTILTNFYWHQTFLQDRVAFEAGIVDATDYVDLYGLVNPWTDFNNLAFSTNPTIPVPNQGVGVAAQGKFAKNYYVIAGLEDANGDPSDPWEGFDSFFNDREYFKHVEVGWFASSGDKFKNNIHLTAWHADERTAAQIPAGWGAAFSFNKLFDDRWLPFLRIGYSDGGGGAILERSVSAGVGYFSQERSDVMGIGLNWGRPSSETFGPGLDDQYTAEFFYRFQVFQHVTISPDVQLLVNPALNPQEDAIWVFGLNARMIF